MGALSITAVIINLLVMLSLFGLLFTATLFLLTTGVILCFFLVEILYRGIKSVVKFVKIQNEELKKW